MSDTSSNQVKKPKLFNLDAFALYTPVENNQRASLQWAIRDGYPRITVFTRIKSDNDGKGFINAPFDIFTFIALLDKIEQTAKSPGPSKSMVTCKHWPRDETGKITGDLEVTSEVWFGKNDDGVVWISVTAPNKPKIVFEFLLSNYHEFKNSKGEPISKSEGSMLKTISMMRLLKHHYTQHSGEFRDTSVPRPQNTYKRNGADKDDKYVPIYGIDADALNEDILF